MVESGAAGGVSRQKPSVFRAVALGPEVPRTLAGRVPAIAVANLERFFGRRKRAGGYGESNAFQAMYDESSDALLHGTGADTFEAVKMLKATDPAGYVPAAGVEYPKSAFGNSLKQVAQLYEGEPGSGGCVFGCGRVGYASEPGGAEGQLAGRLTGFLGYDCGVLERYGR